MITFASNSHMSLTAQTRLYEYEPGLFSVASIRTSLTTCSPPSWSKQWAAVRTVRGLSRTPLQPWNRRQRHYSRSEPVTFRWAALSFRNDIGRNFERVAARRRGAGSGGAEGEDPEWRCRLRR